MSQDQGGPTGYSTHSPFPPEHESPTSQTHRRPIGMGAGRHDRTRVRNASEGADLLVDDRRGTESIANTGDAYSQPGRHRAYASYDYGAPFPSSHVIPNNTVQHGGRDRMGSYEHNSSRSVAFTYGHPMYESEGMSDSQSVSVSAPVSSYMQSTHPALSGQDLIMGRHASPVSAHQASSVPRGSSGQVPASPLRAGERFHPSSDGTRSRAAPLSSSQFMRRDSRPEPQTQHTSLTRTSSYPSIVQYTPDPIRLPPLSSNQSSTRDRPTSSVESAPLPDLMESIRQPFGSQDSSRLLYFDAHTLSPLGVPASEALAGVTSSTSGSTGSSPDHEIVTPQGEEYHILTSEQSPSNPNYATQGTNLPRRKKTSNACHFCRRRKLKCDAGRPCGNCAKRSQSCEYDEKIKRRGPGRRTKDPATAPPPRPSRRRANTSHSASGLMAGEELGVSPAIAPGIGHRPGPYMPLGPSPRGLSLDPIVPTTRNIVPLHRLDPESVPDFEPTADRDSRPDFKSIVDRDSMPDREVVPQLGLTISDTPHRTLDPDTSHYSYGQTRPSRTSSTSTGPTSPQSYSSESMASQPVYSPQHHHPVSQQFYHPAPHGSYGANFLPSQQGPSTTHGYQYIETPREGYDPSADRRFREPKMESPPGLGSHRGHR